MRAFFLHFFVTVALTVAALSTAPAAAATPLAQADADKIVHVIVAQLAAFADDDAEGAFQTATPAVRESIGTPGRFLALVRGIYPMVYRPASVTFHKPTQEDDAVFQLLEIEDSEGKSWLALFAMEQQPDSSWRISGCVVTESHWRSA